MIQTVIYCSELFTKFDSFKIINKLLPVKAAFVGLETKVFFVVFQSVFSTPKKFYLLPVINWRWSINILKTLYEMGYKPYYNYHNI